MTGLDLARRFFTEKAYPAYSRQAPDVLDSLAFGLAGAGSECLGFDDEVSRDHDWGPRVCVWIPAHLYRQRGDKLQEIYEKLKEPFLGFDPVQRLDIRRARDGVLSMDEYFSGYLGTSRPPETLHDWLLIPEEGLATCTNGEVFSDVLGRFTALRNAFTAYFPRDLWLKKIATRCRSAGRHGQYDLWRAHARRDQSAIRHHAAGFSFDIAALAHLTARKYRPYGKWIFRSLRTLGDYGSALHTALLEFADGTGNARMRNRAVEECADIILAELTRSGVGNRTGVSLFDRAEDAEALIDDAGIRNGLDSVN